MLKIYTPLAQLNYNIVEGLFHKFGRKLNPRQFVINSNDFVPKFKTWYEPPIFRKNKYKHNLKRNRGRNYLICLIFLFR